MKKAGSIFSVLILCSSLSGCLGGLIPDPEKEAQDIENEAAATGAACRQSGRSLEECFDRNDAVNRTGALRGWKDMDDYMRQNKLEPQIPVHKPQEEGEEEENGGSKEKSQKEKEPESVSQHKSKNEEKMGGSHEVSGGHEKEQKKTKKSESEKKPEKKPNEKANQISHLQEKIQAMNEEK